MDAATRFRRWLQAGLFLLTAGCHLGDRLPVGRLQAPDDPPDPGAPVARPQAPGEPYPPPVAGAPIQGSPVAPGGVMQVGYIPTPADAARAIVPAGGTPRVKIVAVVGNGNIITEQEVWEMVRQRPDKYLNVVDGPQGKEIVRDDEKEKEVYRQALRGIIDRELILDDMYHRLKKANKTAVADEIRDFARKEADRQIREQKKATGAKSDDEFQSMLRTQGLTVAMTRRLLERKVMADEYVRSVMKEKGKAVGFADIGDYYARHPDEFRVPDRVKWLDIFISVNQFPDARAAYDHAEAIRRQAAGGADFVALSKQYDQGFAARQNGEGTGTARGKILPADVEPTVWALRPGEVSGLVETPVGYHVIKVVERDVAGPRPFDEKTQAEIKRKLTDKLHEQEYKKIVDDLWRKGGVWIIEAP
jgi:parvulin-like peptidyl-prolyl isomerase